MPSRLILFAKDFAFIVAGLIRARMPGSLSLADLSRIRFAVRLETLQPMVAVREEPDGIVVVMTGVLLGPLDGGGTSFGFRRSSTGWEKIGSGLWRA